MHVECRFTGGNALVVRILNYPSGALLCLSCAIEILNTHARTGDIPCIGKSSNTISTAKRWKFRRFPLIRRSQPPNSIISRLSCLPFSPKDVRDVFRTNYLFALYNAMQCVIPAFGPPCSPSSHNRQTSCCVCAPSARGSATHEFFWSIGGFALSCGNVVRC